MVTLFWPLMQSVWPLTSKECCGVLPPVACCESLHWINLGLNVTLEDSQIITECHISLWFKMCGLHRRQLGVLSLFLLWLRCLYLLLVRFPPWPGPYSLRMPSIPSPMLLIPLGEALGPTPLLLLCVDRNCLRVLVDSQSQQGTLSTPPQPLPPTILGWGRLVS